jgi:polygalacturonase
LQLRSDLTFRLQEGAVLKLIPDITLYPKDPDASDTGDGALRRLAFRGDGVANLVIEGPGKIDGSGPRFWDENLYETGLARPTLPRPQPTLLFTNCSNVTVRGLRLENLPGFGISYKACEDGLIEDVIVRNDVRSPNTDGIQIRDSRRIRITGVDIETGDDGIVLKSNSSVVEDIIVENSRIVSDDGAIKFGTGSRYGVKRSTFRNIDISESRYGVAIFAIDGGVHEDNVFENIRIETGGRNARTYPIFVDVDRREADRTWGGVNGLVFRNVEIVSDGASLIAGNPKGRIEDVLLENVTVRRATIAADIADLTSKPRGNKDILAQADSVDYARVPAELLIAHADGVTLRDIALPPCEEAEPRYGLAVIDVTGLETALDAAALPGGDVSSTACS